MSEIRPPRMIAGAGRNEIMIRKSRFICSMNRVTSEDEARAFVAIIRKEFWDASHNCVAWAIGEGARFQRSNDDGEPSGTAGTPMLDVLRRRGLTDSVAVVSRYFGGTLLGSGGLIRAYGRAVSAAIDAIGIVERIPLTRVEVRIDLAGAGRFEHAIRTSTFPVSDVAYDGDGAVFSLALESATVAALRTWIADATNGSAVAELRGEAFVDRRIDSSAAIERGLKDDR